MTYRADLLLIIMNKIYFLKSKNDIECKYQIWFNQSQIWFNQSQIWFNQSQIRIIKYDNIKRICKYLSFYL